MNKSIIVTAMALMLFFAMTSAVSAATVTRDLPGTVDAGADFDVTISQTGFFIVGTVTEILPPGYSYVPGSATDVDSADYNYQTRELKLVIDAGNSSVTYEVKAGTSDGTFTGTYSTIDSGANPDLGDVTGDSIVTITPINGEVTVTRNFPSGSVVDSDATFIVEISQSGFINEGTVSEVIPQGFTYIVGSATNVVSDNYHSGTRTLELTIDSAVGTASYAVVAGTADGTFTGTYVTENSIGNPVSGDVTGDEDITITPINGVVVTRDLPAGTVGIGAQFDVSISQSGFFVVGTVTEVLPDGYSYVSGSATGVDDADYDPDTRTLELVIDSETSTATYQVIAGTQNGLFTGTFATIDAAADPVQGDVIGDNTVTVSTNPVSVSRDLPAGAVNIGAEFDVSITQTGFFVVGTVTEVLPQGYAYVEGSATSADNAQYDADTRTLVLTIDSEISTVTYRVTAGTADGVFTGTFATIDASADPVYGVVAGDDTVTIIPPSVVVTRGLPTGTVDVYTEFEVSITQSGFFVVGIVTEVLPDGYSYVTGSATNVDSAVYDSATRTLKLDIDSQISKATYQVRSGSEDGTFTGTFATIDASADPILGDVSGDDTVTITPDVIVTRDLPAIAVDAGSEFTVSITQTGFFVVGTVSEVLPVGYSYVDGSATNVDDVDYDSTTRTLSLTIDAAAGTVTYNVIAGTNDGTSVGTFATIDANADPVLGDVTGDNQVAICHWRDLWYGDGIITTIELQDAIHHWLEDELVAGCHLLTTEELQEIIALWLSS
jgi:arginine repressor